MIAEEFVDGRELYVSLIGNGDDLDLLPITEMVFDKRRTRPEERIATQFAKWDESYRERKGIRNVLARPIADAKVGSEVLLCLSADSRESVDATVERAVTAGGTADPAPKQDYGVMYGRSVADPDGHIWEIMWMDPAAAERGAEAVQDATSAI